MLDNQPFAAFTRYQREFPNSLRSIHNRQLPLVFPSPHSVVLLTEDLLATHDFLDRRLA